MQQPYLPDDLLSTISTFACNVLFFSDMTEMSCPHATIVFKHVSTRNLKISQQHIKYSFSINILVCYLWGHRYVDIVYIALHGRKFWVFRLHFELRRSQPKIELEVETFFKMWTDKICNGQHYSVLCKISPLMGQIENFRQSKMFR